MSTSPIKALVLTYPLLALSSGYFVSSYLVALCFGYKSTGFDSRVTPSTHWRYPALFFFHTIAINCFFSTILLGPKLPLIFPRPFLCYLAVINFPPLCYHLLFSMLLWLDYLLYFAVAYPFFHIAPVYPFLYQYLTVAYSFSSFLLRLYKCVLRWLFSFYLPRHQSFPQIYGWTDRKHKLIDLHDYFRISNSRAVRKHVLNKGLHNA